MNSPATTPSPTLERYRAAFEARWPMRDALTDLRRKSLEQFLADGFPTQRHEAWKYTNLRRLESRTFALSPQAAVSIDQSRWIPTTSLRVAFVNGHWMSSLSSMGPQPPGLTLVSLGQWLEHEPERVAELISAAQPASFSAFEHLNSAFFEDGVVIEISKDAVIDETLYIVHDWSAHGQQRMSHPRIHVRAGANSRCRIVEHYLGAQSEDFTNAVMTLELAAGAHLSHCRVQQESLKTFHFGSTRVHLHRDARYISHDISMGAALGRRDITAQLEEPGAHAALHGLFIPTGTQHLDTRTLIEHMAARTTSEEEYRGVADGRGRGVFNGKVIVHPDAQKIDARQSSRNLLLSATAEIDTKPELEIYAHDVKCSHGATVGQLDPTSLFYLRSRGISAVDARALLIRAFVESILATIAEAPVREHIEAGLNTRFARPAGAQS